MSKMRYAAEQITMEMGPMGPIGEGGSLMLRINRHCPWNQCLFCHVYKGLRFSRRSEAELIADVDALARVCELLERTSFDIGLSGHIQREVVESLIKQRPDLYGEYPFRMNQQQQSAWQTLSNVASWNMRGSRKVFLQDADALNAETDQLCRVIGHLRKLFPSVDGISAYARSRTLTRKTISELQALLELGLSWCYVGIESGLDELLAGMKKGATYREHVRAGRLLLSAGIHMAAFVMPGLAGADPGLSRSHIDATVQALNEIQPTEVRIRSLAVVEKSPLYDHWMSGQFSVPSDDLMINELGRLVNCLSFDCILETMQLTNVFTVKGLLSHIRGPLLEKIRRYEALPDLERARFILDRYMFEGYINYVGGCDAFDAELSRLFDEARNAVDSGADDALSKVEKAVSLLKSKGIP